MLQFLLACFRRATRPSAPSSGPAAAPAPGGAGRELDEADLAQVVGGLATPALDLFDPPLDP